MRHRHERRHLLVAHLHEFDGAGALQAAEHAVDAVAGISKDPPDAPLMQSVDNEITDLHGGSSGFTEHQPGLAG
jgi:hypothetical protein